MKQLALRGVTPFPPDPISAPDDVVTSCSSEAEAAWARLTQLHGMRSTAVIESMERARGLR